MATQDSRGDDGYRDDGYRDRDGGDRGNPGLQDLLGGGDGERFQVGTNYDDRLNGSDGRDFIFGLGGRDDIQGNGGDDLIFGGRGEDRASGGDGADSLSGGRDNDTLFGDLGNDVVYGDGGNDLLYGDGGSDTAKGADLSADVLNGGSGSDILYQSEGVDSATGGSGADTFQFKFNNPVTPLAANTGAGFTNITDFVASDDTLAFDAAGLGEDATDANFVDNASDGAGSQVDSFFSGAAADANGESVVVVTDQEFASGALVAPAIDGEEAGDLLIYYNTTVGVGSLLYVSAPDTAASIARFTDINSLDDLRNTNFTAADFTFG